MNGGSERGLLQARLALLFLLAAIAWLGWPLFPRFPFGSFERDVAPRAALLLICVLACLWPFPVPGRDNGDERPPGSRLSSGMEALCVTCLMVFAGWLRLADLHDHPWGSLWDEGVASQIVNWIEQGAPFRAFVIYDSESWEMAPFFLQALLGPAFEDPVVALRLPCAVAGVLGVAFVYLLVRRWSGWTTALLAALLLCVNPRHVYYSRIALPEIWVPTLATAAWLFLSLAMEGKRRFWFVLCGLAMGLSFHTYTLGRLTPILILGGLALIAWFDDRPRDGLGSGTGLMLSTAALGALPVALFWWRQPIAYWAHVQEVIGPDITESIPRLLSILESASQLLAIPLNLQSGHQITTLHSAAGATLVALGAALILRFPRLAHGEPAACLLSSVAIGLLPLALLDSGHDPFVPRRFLLVLPVMAVCAARGVEALEKIARARAGLAVPLRLVTVLLLLSAQPWYAEFTREISFFHSENKMEHLLIQGASQAASEGPVLISQAALRGHSAPVGDVSPDLKFRLRGEPYLASYPAGDVFPEGQVSGTLQYLVDSSHRKSILQRFLPGEMSPMTSIKYFDHEVDLEFYRVPAEEVLSLRGLEIVSSASAVVHSGGLRIHETATWEISAPGVSTVEIDREPATEAGRPFRGLLHQGWHRLTVRSGTPGVNAPLTLTRRRLPEGEIQQIPRWDLLRSFPAHSDLAAPPTVQTLEFELRRVGVSSWYPWDGGVIKEVFREGDQVWSLSSGKTPLRVLVPGEEPMETPVHLEWPDGTPFWRPQKYDQFTRLSIARSAWGRWLICDGLTEEGWLFDRGGTLAKRLPGSLLHRVTGVSAGPEGQGFYLTQGTGRITLLDDDGVPLRVTPAADPVAPVITSQGELLVLETGRQVISRYSTKGGPLVSWRVETGSPAARMAVDSRGRVWVLLPSSRELLVYSQEGELLAHPVKLEPALDGVDRWRSPEYLDLAFDSQGRLVLGFKDFLNGAVTFEILER